MATDEATCSCGQLRVSVDGEPIRLSVCHCLACQRRSGSAFAVQARFRAEDSRIEGQRKDFVRISDRGERRTFSFCPSCGGAVFYKTENAPDIVAVPVGAFADPSFPAPTVSVREKRRHEWVGLPALPDDSRHQEDDQKKGSGKCRLWRRRRADSPRGSSAGRLRIETPQHNEDLSRRDALYAARRRPRSPPYLRSIRGLPASSPRIRPCRPGDETPFCYGLLEPIRSRLSI